MLAVIYEGELWWIENCEQETFYMLRDANTTAEVSILLTNGNTKKLAKLSDLEVAPQKFQ